MNTKILGHRGFKSEYPENTLLSFDAALNAGVDGLEFDVHYSKDGELVVFHDFDLEALTGYKGRIFDYTAKDLTKMSINRHGKSDTLPTLESVLSLIEQFKRKSSCGNLCINVELKAGSQLYPQIEKRTLELCTKYLSLDELIFSSFDHEALFTFKEIDEKIITGVLTQSALYNTWDYLKTLRADYYHPHYLTLLPTHLQKLLEHQVKINTYTVNDESVAKQLFDANISAIITDRVTTMLDLRKRCMSETQR